jgi:hypothetical protein
MDVDVDRVGLVSVSRKPTGLKLSRRRERRERALRKAQRELGGREGMPALAVRMRASERTW